MFFLRRRRHVSLSAGVRGDVFQTREPAVVPCGSGGEDADPTLP